MTPMDAPQSPLPSPQGTAPGPGQPTDRAVLEFLAWRQDRLQTLFQFTLAALIILAGALDVFLYKNMRLVRFQLPSQREGTIRFMQEFHKRDDPTIRAFITRLQEFAATNPDFQPILEQYRPHLSAYFLPVPQKAAGPAVTPAQPAQKSNTPQKTK